MHLILDSGFDSLEELVNAVDHWDLDFRLLGTGGFSGRITQLVSDDVLIGYARIHQGLDQRGSTPPGFRTFVIPADDCRGFWWRGHAVSKNDLLVFPPGNELHCASLADFEVYTISIHNGTLERLVHDLGMDYRRNDLREVIPLQAPAAGHLRRLAELLTRSGGGAPARDLASTLVQQLVLSAARDHPQPRPTYRRRDHAVDRILDYVHHETAPSTCLAELCRVAGVSERTLQYAFRERYGIPPNLFVKRWNLNSARRRLLQSAPDSATVYGIASALGFFHHSQFAADYRNLFSEPPSRTLAKSQPNTLVPEHH